MTIYNQIINELRVISKEAPAINVYGKCIYTFILNRERNTLSILKSDFTYVLYNAEITYNYAPIYTKDISIKTQLDIYETLQNYFTNTHKQMEFDF